MIDNDIDIDKYLCGESLEKDSDNFEDNKSQKENLNNINEKNNQRYNNNSKNINYIDENNIINQNNIIFDEKEKSKKKIKNNMKKTNYKNMKINRNDDEEEDDVSINNSMDNDDNSINKSIDMKNENNNISNMKEIPIDNTMIKKIEYNKDINRKQQNNNLNDNEINTNKKHNKNKKNKLKKSETKKINENKINYKNINIKEEIEKIEQEEKEKREKFENNKQIMSFFDPNEDNELSQNNKNFQPVIDDFFMNFSQNILLLNKKYNLNNDEKLFYIYDKNNIIFLTQPLSSIEILNCYIQKRYNIDKVKFRLIDFFCFDNHEPYSFISLKIILNKNWIEHIIINPIIRKVIQNNEKIMYNLDLSEINEKLDYSTWTIDKNTLNYKENEFKNKKNEKKYEDDNEDDWKLIEKKKNKVEKEDKGKKIVGLDIKKQNKIEKESDDLEDLLRPKRFQGKDTTSYGKFVAFKQSIPIEIEDSKKNRRKNKK